MADRSPLLSSLWIAAVTLGVICTNGATAAQMLMPEYRGVNTQFIFGGNSNEMSALHGDWKIDIVRETVHAFDQVPMSGGPVTINGTVYHNLQSIADNNRSNGKITIFAPFSWTNANGNVTNILGADPYQTNWIDWSAYQSRLATMANQFKGQPDVWLEVMNEPYAWNTPTDPGDWYSDMNAMVQAIRATGATNTIVIPGGKMGGDEAVILAKGQDLIAADPANNIVFDLHAYDAWLGGDPSQESLMARMQAILDVGTPFIFGEFGPGSGTPGLNSTRNFIAAVEELSITSLAWMWRGDDDNRIINSDNSMNGGVHNDWWAHQVRNYTQGERANFVPEPSVSLLLAGCTALLRRQRHCRSPSQKNLMEEQ